MARPTSEAGNPCLRSSRTAHSVWLRSRKTPTMRTAMLASPRSRYEIGTGGVGARDVPDLGCGSLAVAAVWWYSAAMIDWTQRANDAAKTVRRFEAPSPRVGLVLGSGLGDVARAIAVAATVETTDIPFFPRSTVAGHAGKLILGEWAGRSIAVLAGRVHGYEGYSAAEAGFSARFLGALGCRALVVTNAAGGLNPSFQPGDLMLIEDHISLPSLAGLSPLVGPAIEGLPRFVDLT